MSSSDSLFDLDDIEFTPVKLELAKVRMIGASLFYLLAIAVIAVPTFLWMTAIARWIGFSVAGVLLLIWVWRMWLIPRQVRALGYYEGERELYLRSGIMFRSLTVVPYGRMQFVDMDEGPIARHYGMATVKLHTASASTDATIEGLPKSEANRLRRALSERGEALMAGL